MERIAAAHGEFSQVWAAERAAALNSFPTKGSRSWEQIWQANGVAYRAAAPLSGQRDQLLARLFERHLWPIYQDFRRGVPEAVDAIIDFLEVDVPAFRCGYAKESYLRDLKTIPLTGEHYGRLRQYGIGLCGSPHHRRELGEVGRLMIRVADRRFVEQLRSLSGSGNEFVRKRAAKMLGVVLNGRRDLRP